MNDENSGLYIYFLLVALLFPVQAQSQTQAPATTYNGLINIKQNKAEVEGDLLKLDMDILLSGLSVGRYQTLILTPVCARTITCFVCHPSVSTEQINIKCMSARLLFKVNRWPTEMLMLY